MKKTRTFSDIDLNFTPVPSAYDRFDVPVDNTETVIITGIKESPIIIGQSTLFQYMISPGDNLYVNSIFIGKIKSIESNTQLTLFNNCLSQFQIDTSTGNTFKYSIPGDMAVKFDENAIKASIRHLVLTMNYERPFNSKIGSQARAMMFELATPMSAILLKQSIINTLVAFEPRVIVLDADVNFELESYNVNVSIYFQIINTTEPLQIDLVLTRSR